MHCEILYENVRHYLTKHVEQVFREFYAHSGEGLLVFYIQEWVRYKLRAMYINYCFQYLNHHYVKREIDKGRKNIYHIYTLQLIQWQLVLSESNGVFEKIMSTVLKLIKNQRNGEIINQDLIKKFVDSIVLLVSDTEYSETALELYQHRFEKPLLEETRSFYEAESKRFLADYSVAEYMDKAERCLDEEEERVRMYLYAGTAIPLKTTCVQALIATHSEILVGEFQAFLDNNSEKDMVRMYNLLSCTPDGLVHLLSKFESHIRKAGLASVAKAASDTEKLEPKPYVGAVHIQSQDPFERNSNEDPCYDISISEDWVYLGGRNFIWLPPDYRATCAAFCNNMLVLGHRSGQVTFFKFRREEALLWLKSCRMETERENPY